MKRDDLTRMNADFAPEGFGRHYMSNLFRYAFAQRLISTLSDVLEIGCGCDTILLKMLTTGIMPKVNTYNF